MYTQKEKSILQILFEKNKYVTSEELSQFTGISKRSIRDVISKLKMTLANEKAFYLISKPRKGYMIRFYDENDRLVYKEKIGIVSKNLNNTNLIQREILVYLHLTLGNGLIKIDEIEDILYLSRTQINNVINALRTCLEPFYVSVDTIPAKGIALKGFESDIRRSMAKLFLINFSELINNEYEDSILSSFLNLYRKIRLQVENIYKNDSKVLSIEIDNMAINLTVAASRIQNNYYLDDYDFWAFENISNNQDIENIKQKYNFSVNKAEESILYYILEAQHKNKHLHPFTNVSMDLVYGSLNQIKNKLGIELTNQTVLIKSLNSFLLNKLNESVVGIYTIYSKKNLTIANLSIMLSSFFIRYIDDVAKVDIDDGYQMYIAKCFDNVISTYPLPKIKILVLGYDNEAEGKKIEWELQKFFSHLVELVPNSNEAECIICASDLQYIDKAIINIDSCLNPTDKYYLLNRLVEIQKKKIYDYFGIRFYKSYIIPKCFTPFIKIIYIFSNILFILFI